MENIKNLNTEQLKELFQQAQAELTRRENLEKEIRWKDLESALRKYLELDNITCIDGSGNKYIITSEGLDLEDIGILDNSYWR